MFEVGGKPDALEGRGGIPVFDVGGTPDILETGGYCVEFDAVANMGVFDTGPEGKPSLIDAGGGAAS